MHYCCQVYVVGFGLEHGVQATALHCKEMLPQDVQVFIINGCTLPLSKEGEVHCLLSLVLLYSCDNVYICLLVDVHFFLAVVMIT